jgi:hypothetical protein
MPIPPAIQGAAAYGGLLFACGFALGVPRTLFLEPRLGPVGAVCLELPLILAIASRLSPYVIRRYAIPSSSLLDLLTMGIGGVVELLALEALLALAFNPSDGFRPFLATLNSSQGRIGLAAQGMAGLFPLLALLSTKHARRRRGEED